MKIEERRIKIKSWREVYYNFRPDKSDKMNKRFQIWLTECELDKLDLIWKDKLYPNPTNPSEKIGFKSRQEFVTFCIGCILNMGPMFWEWFSNILNPKCAEEIKPLFTLGLIQNTD